ncbi:hypothetical protein L798_03885 [Zootermopsis nevadensis]|uniref:Uncharacterized protein n=1 Tax=Zootermopsis nevadensis TaxID=136037 RepID=A0A067RB40_ZOONE|nr:hypothetical protein L798_03885 [Zootermopsis nevadensis]
MNEKKIVKDSLRELHDHNLFLCHNSKLVSRDSSVSIVTSYRLDDRGSIPDNSREFFLCVQTGSGVLPTSYPMGTGVLSRGKTRPGRDADHSPPSSAEVKNE